MADLAVVSANLHNEIAAVRWLRQRGRADHPEHYHLAGVYEAHRQRRALRRTPGCDYLTGPHRGPSQEVGILRDRALPDRGYAYTHLSPVARQFPSVGKERWGHTATTIRAGVTIDCHALHPVAGPDALANGPASHALVQRYRAAMTWLDAALATSARLGHEAVVVGDIQVFEGNTQPWAPRRIFERHQLTWHWHRIDAIAWTPGLAVVRRQTITNFPSDHPALRVELNLNHTHRRNP